MLSLALDDGQLLVIDVETRKIVRRFPGHSNSVTDLVSKVTFLLQCCSEGLF